MRNIYASVIIGLLLNACGGGDSKSGQDFPEKPKNISKSCLDLYSMGNSSLLEKRLRFSSDCKYLNFPESEVIHHFKISDEKILGSVDCKAVEGVLQKATGLKDKLSNLIAKKRAEATDKYDKNISELEKSLELELSKKLLSEVQSIVMVSPVTKHSVMDLILSMEQKGLSYSIDDDDLKSRKLIMKSFLSDRFDSEIIDEQPVSLSNIHYCNLKSRTNKEASYLEYQGKFLNKSFTEVYSASLL